MIQRCLDVLLALIGILVFSPLYLLMAVLIFLEDRGPVLFAQQRLGLHRRPFRIYKFRTMAQGQVTRTGRWLRNTGLDETAQFFNILRGHMSVVGPRPLTPADVTRLGWDTARHDARWHIKPGVTGLAQLHAGRGARRSWLFDRHYVAHGNGWLDCQIILLSFAINIVGKTRTRAWLQSRRRTPWTSWQHWEGFFAARADRPLPVVDAAAEPWPAVPASLAASLAIFQLGESGGGSIVAQVRRSRIAEINPGYWKAMALFVAEEHRHADILAMCVTRLGGSLIRHNWTDHLFVIARRAMGVRLKVLVLMAAEVVGIFYYRLLADRLPPCTLKHCLLELSDDERAHLAFHSEFLRTQVRGPVRRRLFSATWYLVTGLAMVAVHIDHHRAMREFGIPRRVIFARWREHVALAHRLVVNPPFGAPTLLGMDGGRAQ